MNTPGQAPTENGRQVPHEHAYVPVQAPENETEEMQARQEFVRFGRELLKEGRERLVAFKNLGAPGTGDPEHVSKLFDELGSILSLVQSAISVEFNNKNRSILTQHEEMIATQAETIQALQEKLDKLEGLAEIFHKFLSDVTGAVVSDRDDDDGDDELDLSGLIRGFLPTPPEQLSKKKLKKYLKRARQNG